MDKKELLNEKLQQEHQDDLNACANRREFEVKLIFKVHIETFDSQIAEEEAFNVLKESDLNDYLDKIITEN